MADGKRQSARRRNSQGLMQPFSLNQTGTLLIRHLAHFVSAIDICGLIDASAANMFTTDPKSYGRPATRKVILAVAQYVHAQGLFDTLVDVDDLIALPTREL